MADPFAPSPNRLDERFTFPDRARIKAELRDLVKLVEARLAGLEAFVPDWTLAVDGIIADQNQRLVDSIGAQAAQITVWAEEAQQSAEDAQYAASQAGFVDASAYIRRDGSQNFSAVVGGVAPTAGANTAALVTAGWVQTEITGKVDAKSTSDRAYADSGAGTVYTTIVAGAPANLNTLSELAGAIGNNANFASDITTAYQNADSVLNTNITTAYQNADTSLQTSINNRLRTDADQGLNAAAVAQTRRNIRPPVAAKSANYTAVANDIGTLFVCTGGAAWTLSLTAAATLGAGWEIYVRNDGNRVVTIDPNGSELIDGVATLTLLPKQDFVIRCDGTGFYTVGRQNRVRLRKSIIGTAVGALDLTLDDGYDVYEVEIAGHTGDGSSVACRLSGDGGGTFTSSAGAYGYGYQVPLSATADETAWNGVATEMYVIVQPLNTPPAGATVRLYNTRVAGSFSTMRAEMAGRRSGPFTGYQKLVGYLSVARDDNAVRFFPLTGTLTAGTYILSGLV